MKIRYFVLLRERNNVLHFPSVVSIVSLTLNTSYSIEIALSTFGNVKSRNEMLR